MMRPRRIALIFLFRLLISCALFCFLVRCLLFRLHSPCLLVLFKCCAHPSRQT